MVSTHHLQPRHKHYFSPSHHNHWPTRHLLNHPFTNLKQHTAKMGVSVLLCPLPTSLPSQLSVLPHFSLQASPSNQRHIQDICHRRKTRAGGGNEAEWSAPSWTKRGRPLPTVTNMTRSSHKRWLLPMRPPQPEEEAEHLSNRYVVSRSAANFSWKLCPMTTRD